MHLESPTAPMSDFFLQLGGYEGLSKLNPSLVQVGAVRYDLKQKKMVDTLNINIKHDEKTTTWTPTEATYAYAHSLTGMWFNKGEMLPLAEAAQSLRSFIGTDKWVVMNNDFAVIKSQLPDFASDRKERIRLKPLLTNTKAAGLNSGKLVTLLSETEKEATGWNRAVRALGKEHTGCFDALSMAVYCAVNKVDL